MALNLDSLRIHSNWPPYSGEHKVAQFYVTDKPHIRFAGKASRNPLLNY